MSGSFSESIHPPDHGVAKPLRHDICGIREQDVRVLDVKSHSPVTCLYPVVVKWGPRIGRSFIADRVWNAGRSDF
ncbi:hypothetical protein JTE90_012345 [Oedothorax gibbosus]|uniref:Uncharacterized protein n=1 Tax=Oedothorax gibbosus TaxID=931172 RepID=A0AAV6V7B5_9ARAC|nr:hypothetical protein JTE90_012345 [Oedothorax gibbosus]